MAYSRVHFQGRPDVESISHTHSKWSTIFSVLADQAQADAPPNGKFSPDAHRSMKASDWCVRWSAADV